MPADEAAERLKIWRDAVESKVRTIALNTSALDDARAREAIAEVESRTGLPCDDPVRHGGRKLLDVIG